MHHELPHAVSWQSNELYLLDQTQLPQTTTIEKMVTGDDVWQAIYQLKVRGAPAIGVAAAYGICLAMKPFLNLALAEFLNELQRQSDYLDSSRPTAVNLKWALDRMVRFAQQAVEKSAVQNAQNLYDLMVRQAQQIHQEDQQLCTLIGEYGHSLIQPGMGVLTHCNAGSLATTGIGTATAPMYIAHEKDIPFRVYADETRPLLQGSRLTSWELQQSGIDVTLITDNMAASLMSQGLIDLVIVGSDRVAANGDIANKIGTLSVAINAQFFGIPFYVAFPSTTVDLNTAEGKDIVIEEREAHEVTQVGSQITAPTNIPVRNPAFDVTPAHLITGFITEKGILKPPFNQALLQLCQ